MPERYRVIWSPAALADLEAILDYVATRDSSSAAVRLGRKILDKTDALDEIPMRCRVVPELTDAGVTDYREAIVSSYRVVFRVDGATVGIVAVFDGRRDLQDLLLERILG